MMKKTLAILASATALTALLGLPAWSALSGNGATVPHPAFLETQDAKGLLQFVDDDEGEDDGLPKSHRSEREEDDDDDDEDDDDDDGDEDGGSAGNPQPAGAAPPPANGLFGNGVAPKAQVN